MLVGGANEEHFVPLQAPKTRVHVRRQHRTGEIAEMLDAVDVRKRGRDKKAGHVVRDLGRRPCDTQGPKRDLA